jgi:two-component sensor histidine kinase
MTDSGGPVRHKRGSVRRWLVNYPRAIPAAVFGLVLGVTALSVTAIEAGEHQRERAELREEAQAVASMIERRGDAAAAYLRAGAALFATKGELSRPVFGRFVDELRLDSAYFGAEGVGWARAIAPDAVPGIEAELARTFGTAVAVRPAPTAATARLVPVTFLHPNTVRNQRALGFDMYSEAVRRAAMDEAERQAEPTASGRIVLAQEGNTPRPGFLIYMPVFENVGDARQLRGFIYSPFSAADFFASATRRTADSTHSLRLYDGAPDPENLLAELGEPAPRAMAVQQPVTFANRPMTLEALAPREGTFSRLGLLTLLFGVLVASLLLIVVRLLTRQMMEDQAALGWLEEQDSIRQSLTLELNHRVKNTLTSVLSIIALTRRRTEHIGEFADGLEGRVRALSAAHDLLTRSEWGVTPLRDVLEAELAPYLNQADWRVALIGPEIELAPNDVLSLGLAVHELATNAARFGALSMAGGQVDVRWDLAGPKLVRLVWQESGGPPVSGARERGFGLQLVERIVARELGQPVEVMFDQGGVRCTLLIPVRTPSDFALRARGRIK